MRISFYFSVALVCGESSVNINDAILFKLDNFSIFFFALFGNFYSSSQMATTNNE